MAAASMGAFFALSNISAQASEGMPASCGEKSCSAGWDDETVLDKQIGIASSSMSAKAYCDQHGIGDKPGQCQLLSWYEEGRLADPPRKNQQGDTRFECAHDNSSFAISWSRTSTATDSVGASISIGYTIEFEEAPLGLGAKESLNFNATASYEHSWSKSDTYTETDTVLLDKGQTGWVQYEPFKGYSHGIATVYIGSPEKYGVFMYPTNIYGDLPGVDTGTDGDVTHYARWMTRKEWDAHCGDLKPPAQVGHNTSKTSGLQETGSRSVA
ncbi:hypothetical protein AB0N17_43895 [Streptomyces sp. NPDC051133]|uniref:hypothetical protein n=1 Tax=Streptomyces sp. NPDC051133 TaxID=3155521 RepID=UPI00342B53B6